MEIEEILELLQDEYHKARIDAISSIEVEFLSDKRIVEAIITALSDEDHQVRCYAADLFQYFCDMRAFESLKIMLLNEEEAARESAVGALGNFGEMSIPFLLKMLDETDILVQAKLADTLEKFPELTLNPLLAALNDPNPAIKDTALFCLSNFRQDRVFEPIFKIFTDKNEPGQIRRTAAYSLEQFWGEKVIHAFCEVLQDKTEDIDARIGACYLLGQYGVEQAVPALLEALNDENKELREYAVKFLPNLKLENTAELLLNAFKDPSRSVRRRAIEAIDESANKSFIPLLHTFLQMQDERIPLLEVEIRSYEHSFILPLELPRIDEEQYLRNFAERILLKVEALPK